MSSVGEQRFIADKRQIAALLMLTGFCAIIQPTFSSAAAIGADGGTVTEGVPMAVLVGGLCLITTGVLSVYVGYMQVVHDWGHKFLTGAAILFVQTA
jgi:hypothetical protein